MTSGTMRIAVIADDLTGALDTVSPLAERGAAAVVYTSVAGLPAVFDEALEVIGISTNSRHLPADEAAKHAAEAAGRLRAWRPGVVVKKIDSRLKGNVAAECAAVAGALGYNRLLIAPAAPDVGRRVVNGHVVGHGVAVPLDVAGHFAGCPVPFAVADAATGEDLDAITEGLAAADRTLAVGTRGLAAALARRHFTGRPTRALKAEAPMLVAIGTRDPITLRQVETLLADLRFQRMWAEGGDLAPLPQARDTRQNLIVQCTGTARRSPLEVADRFAAGLAAMIRQSPPACLLLSGGDTAAAVFTALGVDHLEVCGEVAPGLPWSVLRIGPVSITILTKSGGFGGPGILAEVLGSAGPTAGTKAQEPAAAAGAYWMDGHGAR